MGKRSIFSGGEAGVFSSAGQSISLKEHEHVRENIILKNKYKLFFPL